MKNSWAAGFLFMPTVKPGEKKKEFIGRCIPMVIDEGTAKDGKQAAAICNSMWEKHVSKKDIGPKPPIKAGARHSAGDQDHMDKALDHMVSAGASHPNLLQTGKAATPNYHATEAKTIMDAPALRAAGARCCMGCKFYQMLEGDMGEEGICTKYEFGAECDWVCDSWEKYEMQATASAEEPQPVEVMNWPSTMELPKSLQADDTLVAFGAEVKALGDGRIGGYLIRYGNENESDLSKMHDWFHEKTYFGARNGDGVDVTIHHGFPLKDTNDPEEKAVFEEISNHLLAPIKTKRDKLGLFGETVINMADEYDRMVYSLAEKGKLRFSSGAVGHLVKRTPMPNGTNRVDQWIIGEVAVTPTPAEPMLGNVLPLKSLLTGSYVPGQAALDGATALTPQNTERKTTMPELQVTPAPAEIPAWALELKTQNEALMAELKKPALPATGAAITAVADLAAEKPFKSLGDQLMAVKAVAVDPSRPDKRLLFLNEKAIKATGASEGTGADGGFLVQQEFTNEALNRVYNTGQIMSKTTKRPVGAGANGLVVNVINETSRALGSRFGGVRAYWLNEAGTKSSSKPTYRRWVLNLEKLIGLYYATDELLQDAVGLQGDVMDSFSKEINFACEDAVINGLGAGAPLGILNAPATVSVSKETGQAAATIVTANLFKMWARMWAPARAQAAWLIDQSIEPQLMGLNLSVGTGGMPVYIPPGGLSASPYSMLLGRPVIPVEYCAVLGTVGDIILADLGEYRWIDKGGIVSAASIHVQFLTDETAFRFVYRCNGAPFWNSALTPKSAGDTLSPFITLATRA